MTQKQIIILASLVLFIAVLVIAGLTTRKTVPPVPNDLASSVSEKGVAPDLETLKKSEAVYTPEVPKDAELTPPKNEAPASANPKLDTKARFFDLKAAKDGFSPPSVTVNSGDTLYIDFAAVDDDYDLDIPYLGVYFSTVKKGETRRLPFDTSTPGTFIFQCRDQCPSSGQIKGQLIVLPR